MTDILLLCDNFINVHAVNRPLKNVFEAADARQKQAKSAVYA